MQKETFQFAEKEGVALQADFYRSSKKDARTVIYFHGGGLVYGTRNDLDEKYITQFLKAGYHLFTVDYRLAPETKLPAIYTDVQDAILWFTKHFNDKLQLHCPEFALFGRSSGAYLALCAASDPSLPQPFAVLSFYGFSSIKDDWIKIKSPFFNKYPQITETLKNTMIKPYPIVEGLVQHRYPLYIYIRQNGKWLENVVSTAVSPSILDKFSLRPAQDFHFLPPLFLAHSNADEDVPFNESEKLAQGTLKSEFHVVDGLPHDFDTKTVDAEGALAYQAAIRFLNRQKEEMG